MADGTRRRTVRTMSVGRGQLFAGAVILGAVGGWLGRSLLVRQPADVTTKDGSPQLPGERRETEDRGHAVAADWFANHPEQLALFPDEWVAVLGREVVAHDPSMIEVVRLARERGYDDPLLIPVTPSETTIV
jgi:hypothetical protein